MRAYEDVVEEIARMWSDGLTRLAQATAIAREQGFQRGVLELASVVDHVEGVDIRQRFESGRDPDDRLREIEQFLSSRIWQYPADHQYPGAEEVWIICPRAHAERHHFRIPQTRVSITIGRELFRMAGRFLDGDDLVYAIAPLR